MRWLRNHRLDLAAATIGVALCAFVLAILGQWAAVLCAVGLEILLFIPWLLAYTQRKKD